MLATMGLRRQGGPSPVRVASRPKLASVSVLAPGSTSSRSLKKAVLQPRSAASSSADGAYSVATHSGTVRCPEVAAVALV